ncbi:MAG: type II toxin-antitoxin system RnlA family toxin [Saprospiraceae bacterium]|nr:type II toxin-antitoxin system RnlA family toxin [Saprospiraceae bacterium]
MRFIADNSDALNKFNAVFNPELQNRAEENIKAQIGIEAFAFLEEHDRKYLVASECLRLCNIPLPEFSPIVMPASKAFEGFTKKLVIALNIEDATYFQYKNANFAKLKDKTQPRTKAVIEKDRYAETYLNRLILSLDMFRNFMLHSDDSAVTKVNTFTEAESKLNDLFKELQEIYHYFKSNTVFGI